MNKTCILLVEDNPDDVTLTEIAFKKASVSNKLIVAYDGRQALNYLSSLRCDSNEKPDHKPGLILLDLKLPIVSGLDVLKEVMADKSTSAIPVIVLTSSSEEKDRAESHRLGAREYIRKPTSLTEFIEVIKKIKVKWLDTD